MLRRCITALTFVAGTMLIHAGERYLTVLDNAVETLNYHLRLSPGRRADAAMTMYWDYADSLNYSALRIAVPSLIGADDLIGTRTAYSVHRVSSGRDSILTEGEISLSYRPAGAEGLSAVLRVFDGKAFLDIGSRKAEKTIPVNFSNTPGLAMGYSCTHALAELRNDIRYTGGVATSSADFESVEDLTAYIRSSKDPVEGLWKYLDRDIDLDKAQLGGTYSLATVRRPDGDYDIIFLAGANMRRSDWQPLRIKGRLRPTIFDSHFDLEWHTATGVTLREDTHATIEQDGAILRLNFPLSNSSIRFSRVRQ